MGAKMSDKNMTETFVLPYLYLLDDDPEPVRGLNRELLNAKAALLEKSLKGLGVDGKVVGFESGPVVSLFDFAPAQGVTFKDVFCLSDELGLAVGALPVRIVPSPSRRGLIGLEMPNPVRETVGLKDLLSSDEFQKTEKQLPMAMGKDVFGNVVVSSLASTPHILGAGACGMGKSTFIHSLVLSLLYTSRPEDVKILMIDPKLELSIYADLPHLMLPLLTDPLEASRALQGLVREMERRYDLMACFKGIRNIEAYNQKIDKEEKVRKKVVSESPAQHTEVDSNDTPLKHCHLPHLVVIIDELADLMMVAGRDVEEAVARLGGMARSAGIHLVLFSQRPSKDVLSALIRVNCPTRLCFKVFSRLDSQVVLDQTGGESLLGGGDYLFLPPVSHVQRVQGAFVSEAEVQRVVDFLKAQGAPAYDETFLAETSALPDRNKDEDEHDEKWHEALELVTETRMASIAMLQRRLRLGYNRAARMIERMEKEGFIGPYDGNSHSREVYSPMSQSTEVDSTVSPTKGRLTFNIDEKLWLKALKLKNSLEPAFAQYLQLKIGISREAARAITKEMVKEGLLKLDKS